MITIDLTLTPEALKKDATRLFELSREKIALLHAKWSPANGTPVYTVEGRYTSRGWTEWTQGFVYGSALLQFAATEDKVCLDIGREGTLKHMATHVSHVGVHDHGFNNVSTYGNLLRLARHGKIPASAEEIAFYEFALKVSGAVQASRWTELPDGEGYIYSFNGPHSLFADTIRSLRVLALAHSFGHVLMGERDRAISLMDRLLRHLRATLKFNVYYGEGRDHYDVRGRVAHESIFNVNDGSYRCPSSQQGYSPFTTWTRGLAWILCGIAEQLEFLATRPEAEFAADGGRAAVLEALSHAGRAVADFYLQSTPTDGVPYWDTGAPGLAKMGNYLDRPADPFNDYEPVDSSAAAIAAQGLLRLGRFLNQGGTRGTGAIYVSTGLTVARTLFSDPYLSRGADHQGLLLHSVYHRPNGWDHIPRGRKVPSGESSMWGDYHARELAHLILSLCRSEDYYTFFN